jgi:hypothetical protein
MPGAEHGHVPAAHFVRAVAAHFLHFFDFELQGEPTFDFFVTLGVDELKLKVTPREGRFLR